MDRTEVKRLLLQRYARMLEAGAPALAMAGGYPLTKELTTENLTWMCATALDGVETLPDDKVQRWIGFVQYGVVLHGLTTVQLERDFTRPLMHAVYAAEGLAIPPTLNMEDEDA